MNFPKKLNPKFGSQISVFDQNFDFHQTCFSTVINLLLEINLSKNAEKEYKSKYELKSFFD